ncbi:MAG: DUF2012 domain-containing protein [Thermoguttaceae bacterium]|nr:DUF2012 domain-containing protein [Thermoguttaceae bacterium]
MELAGLTITGGKTTGDGGGIYNHGTLTLTNCTVSGNTASSYGGGIYNYSGTLTLTNCTVSGNTASSYGGGIYNYSGTLNIYNSIVVSNSVSNKGADIYRNSGTVKAYNTLYSNVSGVTFENCYEYDDSLPLFTNPNAGDYTLVADSQAVDLGNDQYAFDAGLDPSSVDAAGGSRFCGFAIDLGAYELQSNLRISQKSVYTGDVLISYSASEGESKARLTWNIDGESFLLADLVDGDSWTWQTSGLSDGWGTLKADYLDESGNVIAEEERSCLILNDENVVVHRGRITESETWASDKVHLVVGGLTVGGNATVTVEADAVVKFWKWSYFKADTGAQVSIGDNVVLTRAEDDSAGGDTNMDGNASVPRFGQNYFRGGGTFSVSASAELRYVETPCSGNINTETVWLSNRVYHVTGNVTVNSTLTIMPGAIVKFDRGCSLIVNGTLNANGSQAAPIVFTSYRDDAYGGDLDEDDGVNEPQAGDWKQIHCNGGSVTLDHTYIRYCSDTNNQGGIYITGGNVTFTNSRISYTMYDAMRNNGGSFTAYNSIFEESSMALRPNSGTTTVTNCVIANSTTAVRGTSGTITNTVFYNITNVFFDWGTISCKNCLFYNPKWFGPQSAEPVGSNGNIWADPLFRNADAGDYHLTAGSPCIDAANGEIAPETDKDGVPRIDDPYAEHTGTVTANGTYADIGAYEFADTSAYSDRDIAPVNVQVSIDSASIGDTVRVQWTVQNVGNVPISGQWRDALYLVSESGDRILLKEAVNTASIAVGDVATFYADVEIPAVREGNWKIAVNVNPNRDIFEGANSGNNWLAGSSVSVQVPEIPLESNLALEKNGTATYRMEVAAGESFWLVSDSTDVTIKIREDFVPTEYLYDVITEVRGDKSALRIEAASEDRVFYVTLSSAVEAPEFTLQMLPGENELPTGDEIELNWDAVNSFETTLNLPSAVRVGRVYKASVTVTNTSEYNIPAPFFAVVPYGCGIALTPDGADSNREELSVLAITSTDDAVYFTPGESRTITIYVKFDKSDDAIGVAPYRYTKDDSYVDSIGNIYGRWEEYHTLALETAQKLLKRGKVVNKLTELEDYMEQFRYGDGTGISGHLVDRETGLPIAGSEMTAVYKRFGEKRTASLTTDENGAFCFDYLPADTKVALYAANAYYLSSGTIELDGEDVTNLNVLASQKVAIAGMFRKGEDTIDYSRESVRIRNLADGSEVDCHLELDGRFSVETLPAGDYLLVLSPGIVASNESELRFSVTDGSSQNLEINVTAAEKSSFSAVFTDSDGNPLANVKVGAYDGDTYLTAETNAQGRCRFSDLLYGIWKISAEKDGYVSSYSDEVSLLPGDESDVVIRLCREATINGRVIDENGSPLEGVDVFVSGQNSVGYAVTNEDGVFTADGVGVGLVNIQYVKDGYLAVETSVSAESTTTIGNVEMAKGASIAGRLDHERAPCIVYVLNENGDSVSSAVVEEDGTFSFNSLAEGVYTLSASYGKHLYKPIQVTLSKGQNKNVALQTVSGQVSGKVATQDGMPVAGVKVYLISTNEDGIIRQATTETDKNGNYYFASCPDGEFALLVSGGSWVSETAFLNGTDVESVIHDIIVVKSCSVTGTVLGSDGNVIPSMIVTLTSKADEITIVGFSETNENGAFQMASVPTGEYVLTVKDNDGNVFHSEVVVIDNDVEYISTADSLQNISILPQPGSGYFDIIGDAVDAFAIATTIYPSGSKTLEQIEGNTKELDRKISEAFIDAYKMKPMDIDDLIVPKVPNVGCEHFPSPEQQRIFEEYQELVGKYHELTDKWESLEGKWYETESKLRDLQRTSLNVMSNLYNTLANAYSALANKCFDAAETLRSFFGEDDFVPFVSAVVAQLTPAGWMVDVAIAVGLTADAVGMVNSYFSGTQNILNGINLQQWADSARKQYDYAKTILDKIKGVVQPYKEEWESFSREADAFNDRVKFYNELDASDYVTSSTGSGSATLHKGRLNPNPVRGTASNIRPGWGEPDPSTNKPAIMIAHYCVDTYGTFEIRPPAAEGKYPYDGAIWCGACGHELGEIHITITVTEKKDPEDPHSCDPNEISGPVGSDFTTVNAGTEEEPLLVVTGKNWVNAGTMDFTVNFENKNTAAAAAQEIFVNTALSEEYDWSTLSLGEICVGNEVYTLSDSNKIADGIWRVSQKSTGEQIEIRFEFDESIGLASWYLRSYVASTADHYPESAYDGFLPTNDETGRGEGYVSFTVTPKSGIETGTRIETSASIVFDTNEAINTNVWVNTIDADAPVMDAVSLEKVSPYGAHLSWTAEDEASGVASYDVFYSVDGGSTWTTTASGITETSYKFVAESDGDYLFRVRARDGAGNADVSVPTESVGLLGTELAYAEGWSGDYDGQAHSVTVTVTEPDPENDVIYYTVDGVTSTEAPQFVDPGVYTVSVTVERNGSTYWTGSAVISISKLQSEQLDKSSILTGTRGFYVSYGANRHQITWSSVANASGYELAYSSNGGVDWTSVSTSETSAIVRGLTYGVDMMYRVRAIGSDTFEDSAWSAVKTFNVCPSDVNGDGDVSASDRTVLANAWLTEEGDDRFTPAADMNGDGEISLIDRSALVVNWLLEAGDPEMFFPRPKAADAAFAGYEPGDLDVDWDVF